MFVLSQAKRQITLKRYHVFLLIKKLTLVPLEEQTFISLGARAMEVCSGNGFLFIEGRRGCKA